VVVGQSGDDRDDVARDEKLRNSINFVECRYGDGTSYEEGESETKKVHQIWLCMSSRELIRVRYNSVTLIMVWAEKDVI
jgi:hypothetical protein